MDSQSFPWFKNRPQNRKMGSGAGRVCKQWDPWVLGYVAGRAEAKLGLNAADLSHEREYSKLYGLTKEWYESLLAHPRVRQEFESRPQTQTPVWKLLDNRLYKMWWENRKPMLSREHPLRRGIAPMLYGYQLGKLGESSLTTRADRVPDFQAEARRERGQDEAEDADLPVTCDERDRRHEHDADAYQRGPEDGQLNHPE